MGCYIFHRIDDISYRFRHFLSIDSKMTSNKNLMRSFISRTPEHSWPINSMKSDNIFSNNVKIYRPPDILFSLTYSQIVKKCIIPYIGNLVRIKWKWDTEFIGLTRYRKIFKSFFHKFYHFIISRFWIDKFRMILIECQKSILVFRKSKEIIFLL